MTYIPIIFVCYIIASLVQISNFIQYITCQTCVAGEVRWDHYSPHWLRFKSCSTRIWVASDGHSFASWLISPHPTLPHSLWGQPGETSGKYADLIAICAITTLLCSGSYTSCNSSALSPPMTLAGSLVSHFWVIWAIVLVHDSCYFSCRCSCHCSCYFSCFYSCHFYIH